jgi:hypothetical protein
MGMGPILPNLLSPQDQGHCVRHEKTRLVEVLVLACLGVNMTANNEALAHFRSSMDCLQNVLHKLRIVFGKGSERVFQVTLLVEATYDSVEPDMEIDQPSSTFVQAYVLKEKIV